MSPQQLLQSTRTYATLLRGLTQEASFRRTGYVAFIQKRMEGKYEVQSGNPLQSDASRGWTLEVRSPSTALAWSLPVRPVADDVSVGASEAVIDNSLVIRHRP